MYPPVWNALNMVVSSSNQELLRTLYRHCLPRLTILSSLDRIALRHLARTKKGKNEVFESAFIDVCRYLHFASGEKRS